MKTFKQFIVELAEMYGKGSLDKIHKHHKDEEKRIDWERSFANPKHKEVDFKDASRKIMHHSSAKDQATVMIRKRNHDLVKNHGGSVEGNRSNQGDSTALHGSKEARAIIRSKYGKDANTQTYPDGKAANYDKTVKRFRKAKTEYTTKK